MIEIMRYDFDGDDDDDDGDDVDDYDESLTKHIPRGEDGKCDIMMINDDNDFQSLTKW